MKSPPLNSKKGSILFYVMGIAALLSLLAMVSTQSAMLEHRSAQNKVQEVQALMHARAGVELVKSRVQSSLSSGLTLEQSLNGLSVTAPTGFEFDTIRHFDIVVPMRIFQFTSTGRSGDAEVTLNVQFRRREMFQAGIFGDFDLSTQPRIDVYGYDSREISHPSAADSNGAATIGGNQTLNFGNFFNLDGTVAIGADESGNDANCSDCSGLETVEVGYLDPDPLGANNNGELSQLFDQVILSNDNASNPAITGTVFITRPGDSVTFTAGDYYLTDVDTAPNTNIIIDESAGPVRFFVDGEVYFAPNNGLSLNDPLSFQIYSRSTESVRIQPNGDLSAFIYAPNAQIELWPNGAMKGGYWGNEIQLQPGGDFFVDTSLQDRWFSNQLATHLIYESRLQ